ncbi:MAG: hypothetical protein QTN59_14010 [Candidatus Electrothrix communis]|nr:MAG: hypothetical protein QTN59_14010 [Candidatus Electrothrix communis]
MSQSSSFKKFNISKKFDVSKKGSVRFNIDKKVSGFRIQPSDFLKNFANTSTIDAIFRKIESPDSTVISSSTDQIIAIDVQSGQIVQHQNQRTGIRGIFRLGQREVWYYRVSSQNVAECRTLCPVNDIDEKISINIQVIYSVRCHPGNESKVATTLYKENNPGEILRKAIMGWVDNFVQSRAGFIQNYFQLRNELREHICLKAQLDFGLTLQINLTLEHEDNLVPFPITSSEFFVRVNGCDEEIGLRFATELHVDEYNKILAIVYHEQLPELERFIQEIIKQSILDHFGLEDLCYELNQKVRRVLEEELRAPLSQAGRMMSYLSLESSASSLVPEEVPPVEHTVKCKIKECPRPIDIEHRVLLSLTDISKYRAAKITSLEDWVKSKLERITEAAFFERSYVDILLEFNPHEIKRTMEREAESIGYTIRHLTAIPDLEPLKLKDGFKIESEEEFVTHDSRVKVKLQLIVKGAIQDLRGIEEYLNPQIDISEKIRSTVVEETEQLIHKVDPERFYMHYYDDSHESVEKELKDQIKLKLEQKFGVSDIHITAKQLETKIAKRFQELQKGFDSFEFEIFPLKDEGYGEPVKFHIDFKVRGVDQNGWYIFQSNDFKSREEEIEHIKKVLEGDVKTKLETVPIDYIQYTDIRKWQEIKGAVDLSVQKIVSTFGLVIEIINLRRLPTVSELGTQQDLEARRRIAEDTRDTEIQMASLTNKEQLEQLERLLQKRRELIDNSFEDDPEFEVVNQRIQKIIQVSPTYSIKSDRQQLEHVKNQSPEQLSLKEYLGGSDGLTGVTIQNEENNITDEES